MLILLWCLSWDLYSKVLTELNDWNRDIWVLGLACGNISFMLYIQKSEGCDSIKNSVWVLLPAGEVHGKERSQVRRGIHTRAVRVVLHPWSQEGRRRRVPSIGGGMQERGCSATAARDQRTWGKCFYPLHKACKLKVRSDVSCMPFLLHTCGELSKRSSVSVPDRKMYVSCVWGTRGDGFVPNQLQQSVLQSVKSCNAILRSTVKGELRVCFNFSSLRLSLWQIADTSQNHIRP